MKNTKSSSTAIVQKSTTTNKPQPTSANRPQAATTNEPKTTTDNETKFFNQKNFLIGFNDDIYDYIFIAWFVISNISLSLGIKFKKGYTNNYESNGHDYDKFMQPPPPQNFPHPA